MKHTELTNHIRGSILKQQYLEAFLVQGAYIESLLKMHADFSLWLEINELKNSDLIKTLRKDVSNYGLYRLIEFLRRSKLISDTLAQQLHIYRDKRNEIVHRLLDKIYSASFEQEMRLVCELGEKLTSSGEFSDILDIIASHEEQIEAKQLELKRETKEMMT